MVRRLLIAVAVMSLGAVFAVPGAQAAFGIEKMAGTDVQRNTRHARRRPGRATPGPVAGPVHESTASKWFTQAAGHPNWGITDFTLNTFLRAGGRGFPEGFVKDIIVDTPEGLERQPRSRAPVHRGTAGNRDMPAASQVGINYLTVAAARHRHVHPHLACRPGSRSPSTTSCPSTGRRRWSDSRPRQNRVFIVGSLEPG